MEADYAVLWACDCDVTPGFQYSYIAFGPNLLEKDRDAGRRFIVAYLKGARRFNQGKTERNLDIVARHTIYDRGTLERIGWIRMQEDGMLDVESVLEMQRWAKERGLIDRVLEPDEFWDPSFIEYAVGVTPPHPDGEPAP
jgi:NitT/TauT family transport system substrate-binding protein